jgi:hypothetical protein
MLPLPMTYRSRADAGSCQSSRLSRTTRLSPTYSIDSTTGNRARAAALRSGARSARAAVAESAKMTTAPPIGGCHTPYPLNYVMVVEAAARILARQACKTPPHLGVDQARKLERK